MVVFWLSTANAKRCVPLFRKQGKIINLQVFRPGCVRTGVYHLNRTIALSMVARSKLAGRVGGYFLRLREAPQQAALLLGRHA